LAIPETGMVAAMIVHIPDKDIEHHPQKQFTRLFGKSRAYWLSLSASLR
jgi:hypothetical protein